MSVGSRGEVPVEEAAGAALDTEFQHHLTRGSDLLQSGDARAARDALEHAVRLRPRYERAQNLLGLAYFKLGDYDRAEAVYRRLIDDNPADATLRVNLGLVHLKTGLVDAAIRCFRAALDLNPEHQKAENYLGLAYAQIGEHAKARASFIKAGNEQMAERMAQLLGGAATTAGATGPAGPDIPFRPPETPAPEVPPPSPEYASWYGVPPEPAPAPERPAAPEPAPQVYAPPAPAAAAPTGPIAPPSDFAPPAPEYRPPAPGYAPPAPSAAQPSRPGLQGRAAEALLEPPPGFPFGIGGAVAGVQVRGELLSRVDGLVSASGRLAFRPELKRYRGQTTDQPFGEPTRRMMRVAGQGRLLVARQGRTFTALALDNEAAYFREECVFAFEESLVFENGRMPSRVSPDLHLVHLRGSGGLLLVTRGRPRALAVAREPLHVPVGALVGWYGAVTPRILALSDQGGPDGGPLAVVELGGEGGVWVEYGEEPP